MEFLGIGPLELLFIIIIALLLFGPKDMLKTGRTVGSFLRNILKSEGWFELKKSLRELRNLPYTMMREAGMEDVIEDVRDISRASKLNDPLFEPFPKKIDPNVPANTWIEPPLPEGSQRHKTRQISEENQSSIEAISPNPTEIKPTSSNPTGA